MPELRLLTYNVRSLRDDAAAVGRVIRAVAPDVVCIQEAPRFLRWRSKCAALARSAGMVIVTGGRPCGANLILSTLAVDVDATRDVAFTTDPRLHHRGAALAVLRLRGTRFAVAGTHLDLEAAPRLRHVHELHAALDDLVPAGVATIVAGDTNDEPGSAVWQALGRRGADAFAVAGRGDGLTSTPLQPRTRIDAVFAGEGITVRGAEAIDSPDVRLASDHRPLLVELEI